MQLQVLAFVQLCSFQSNISGGKEGAKAKRGGSCQVYYPAGCTRCTSNQPFLLTSPIAGCGVICLSSNPFLKVERDQSNQQRRWKSDLPTKCNKSKLQQASLYKKTCGFKNKQGSKIPSGLCKTHVSVEPRLGSVTVPMGKTGTPVSAEAAEREVHRRARIRTQSSCLAANTHTTWPRRLPRGSSFINHK